MTPIKKWQIWPHASKYSREGRSPTEICEITRAREKALSRRAMAYIDAGLAFMLLPATFLGGNLGSW